MEYSYSTFKNIGEIKHDCIVVPVYSREGETIFSKIVTILDEKSGGKIKKFIQAESFEAELGQTHCFYDLEDTLPSKIVVIGCGAQNSLNARTLVKFTEKLYESVGSYKLDSLAVAVFDDIKNSLIKDLVTQFVILSEGVGYQFNHYLSEIKQKTELKQIELLFRKGKSNIQQALDNGTAIAKGMSVTRDLGNHPSNVCTPMYIAEQARELESYYAALSVDILEEDELKELGMNAFLSISKGSVERGKVIVLKYQGANDSSLKPVVLVGKGITFDTGGVSIKAADRMDEMKFDMGGAAAMLGTLVSCLEMKLQINVVVALAVAENMVSGNAVKPGDIITSMSGKTIEVLNTDAEGRMVLCDVLTYIARFEPEIVIDAATLTGAAVVALGQHYSALFSNDQGLAESLIEAGKIINDRAWQLPLDEAYNVQLKSTFADIANIGGPAAGAVTAACFLAEFTKEYKWAHLDIAGSSCIDKKSTARPVALLSQYLYELSKCYQKGSMADAINRTFLI